MRLVGKKARKALGKSGSGDVMQDADTDVNGDIHQPLLHSHEEYRRRKDNRQKHTVHIKVAATSSVSHLIASPTMMPPQSAPIKCQPKSAANSSKSTASSRGHQTRAESFNTPFNPSPQATSQDTDSGQDVVPVGMGVVTWEKLKKLFMPSLLYQIGVITQGMGLRYTSASVNQMISGSCIIFTAVFSVIFLQRNLNWRHWSGLMLACMGICVVSMASLHIATPDLEIDEDGRVVLPRQPEFTTSEIAYGIFMTVFSQVVGAAQMVWEEAYITDLRLAPLQVMGWEGIWGIILDIVVFLPLAAIMPGPDVGGIEENTLDTAVMLYNSHTIRWVALFFFVSVAGTSQFGIIVSSRLGSLFRAVLLTARTALIWLMDLTVFYNNIGPDTIGEGWGHTSPVRALGFMFLLAGTGLYARECMSAKKGDSEKRLDRPKKSDGGKGRGYSDGGKGRVYSDGGNGLRIQIQRVLSGDSIC